MVIHINIAFKVNSLFVHACGTVKGAFLVSNANTDFAVKAPQRQEAEMLQTGSDRNNWNKVTEASGWI